MGSERTEEVTDDILGDPDRTVVVPRGAHESPCALCGAQIGALCRKTAAITGPSKEHPRGIASEFWPIGCVHRERVPFSLGLDSAGTEALGTLPQKCGATEDGEVCVRIVGHVGNHSSGPDGRSWTDESVIPPTPREPIEKTLATFGVGKVIVRLVETLDRPLEVGVSRAPSLEREKSVTLEVSGPIGTRAELLALAAALRSLASALPS